MARYIYASSVNGAVLDDNISSFKIADVSFLKKSCLTVELVFLTNLPEIYIA